MLYVTVKVLASVKAIYHRALTCHLYITVDLPEQPRFIYRNNAYSSKVKLGVLVRGVAVLVQADTRSARFGNRVKCDDGPVASAVY